MNKQELTIRELNYGAKFFVVIAALFLYGAMIAGMIAANYLVVVFGFLGFLLSIVNAILWKTKANEKKEA